MTHSKPMVAPPFIFPVRVYYEDTDAAGVVYYANYLKFAERARTEWLRSLGFSQEALMREQGVGFVVASANITYHKPARLDDQLFIVSHLQHTTKVRMGMQQTVTKDEQILARVAVEIVCVDTTFKPTRIPDALLQAFATERKDFA